MLTSSPEGNGLPSVCHAAGPSPKGNGLPGACTAGGAWPLGHWAALCLAAALLLLHPCPLLRASTSIQLCALLRELWGLPVSPGLVLSLALALVLSLALALVLALALSLALALAVSLVLAQVLSLVLALVLALGLALALALGYGCTSASPGLPQAQAPAWGVGCSSKASCGASARERAALGGVERRGRAQFLRADWGLVLWGAEGLGDEPGPGSAGGRGAGREALCLGQSGAYCCWGRRGWERSRAWGRRGVCAGRSLREEVAVGAGFGSWAGSNCCAGIQAQEPRAIDMLLRRGSRHGAPLVYPWCPLPSPRTPACLCVVAQGPQPQYVLCSPSLPLPSFPWLCARGPSRYFLHPTPGGT